MCKITKVINVYRYNELSEDKMIVAKSWYLKEYQSASSFKEACLEELKRFFPTSDLKLQSSLEYSQGDGLNIYGKLNLQDVFGVILDKADHEKLFMNFRNFMTEQEQRIIEEYAEVCGFIVELPVNAKYAYSIAEKVDFAEDWIEKLESCNDKNKRIQVNVIYKMERLVSSMFARISASYVRRGYKYLYEVEEEEMEEMSESNNWEFLENGMMVQLIE